MTGASTCGEFRNLVFPSHGLLLIILRHGLVYKSCSAGYWGAGNTYSDCFECPLGMASLEGKAFYETDCFLPCGDVSSDLQHLFFLRYHQN